MVEFGDGRGWSTACGCELVPGVHDPADHPHALPVREVKNVPLVTYREGGERIEIGRAEVRPDGTVSAHVRDTSLSSALFDTAVDGFSFGIGQAPADVLAGLRAENERLRQEVTVLSEALEKQVRAAAVMRRDVAELARQAGVLLEGQGGS